MNTNFEKMYEQLDQKIDSSKKEKAAAEKVIKDAEDVEKNATKAKAQLKDAQKKYEAFETSYNAAMQMTGNNSNVSEEKKSDNFGVKEGISLALAASIIFGAAGYAIGYNQNSNKDKNKTNGNTDGKKYYLNEETGEYLPYDQPLYVYNEETNEYEAYVTEFYTIDDNGQYVPYETKRTIENIEEYNKLISDLQSTLVVREDEFDGLFKAISNDSQLLESFVNALNFYSIAGNQELVAELRANGDLGEDAGRYILINNADRVRDNILSYNIMKYMETKSTDGFIDISDFIYDETQCELVADMEYALEEIAKLVSEGKSEEANQKVDSLFDSLERGELYNVDNSIGYFVVRYVASMISDIMMNSGMNMTGVSINEENLARAEILKGSVCDDFDQTIEGGLGNLYYRNLMASIEGLVETLDENDTLSNVDSSVLKRTRGLL